MPAGRGRESEETAVALAAVLWGGAALCVPWALAGTPLRDGYGGVPGGIYLSLLATGVAPVAAGAIHHSRRVGCAMFAAFLATWSAWFWLALHAC